MQGVGALESAQVEEKAFVSEAQENNKVLVRRFLEEQAKGNFDVIDELLSPTSSTLACCPAKSPIARATSALWPR
jgi:hypothetical protein